MILPTNHIANWSLIRQRKQAEKIGNEAIHEISTRVYHEYIFGE